jgi:hypothetical protein
LSEGFDLRRPARWVALAGALALCACGGKDARQTEDGGAALPVGSVAPSAPADEGAPPAAPGEAPAQQTPEQDSIQEARLYDRRRRSMESYDSCMLKAAAAEGPARAAIEAACARSRH